MTDEKVTGEIEQILSDASGLPERYVCPWTGPIPPGWKICDGTDGTPDFRSQFVLTEDGEPIVVGIIKD